MKKIATVILLSASVYSLAAQPDKTQLPESGVKKPAALTESGEPAFPLAGTWLLKAAEVMLPDGTRITDSAYGTNAKGVLMVDEEGQYSLQIFRPDRLKFAAGDKRKGTPAEYESALLGISTHTGHIKMDTVKKTLQFNIDYAAYPNWDNTVQTRNFKLSGEELYYEVPAKAAGGTIAVSTWKRVKTK